MVTPYQIGIEAISRGDLRTAQDLLREALQHDSSDDRARRALATTSLQLGDVTEALTVLYPLVVRSPDDAELLDTYGRALRKAGRYNDAAAVLAHANAIDPSPGRQAEIAEARHLAANDSPAIIPGSGVTGGVAAAGDAALGSRPSRVPAAAPDAGARDEPSAQRNLAEDLDKPPSDVPPGQMRGAVQASWHRRTTSYRRFWGGILLILITFVLLIAHVAHKIGYSAAYGGVSNLAQNIENGLVVVLILGVVGTLSAIVSARFTRYTIYERRIDFERGVISQRRTPVWLYDITGLEMRRPPLLTLTGTASILITYDAKESKPSVEKMIATGGVSEMTRCLEQLQVDYLQERRAMKKIWI